MAGRTRADATLMGTWGEGGGGERLGVTKGSERDGAIELESILHIIALSVFSRREVAIAVFAACGVVWCVCACGRVSICFCALTHFSTLPRSCRGEINGGSSEMPRRASRESLFRSRRL